MPIYAFRCEDCGSHFEVLLSVSGHDVTCPNCVGSHVTKLVTPFATPGMGQKSSSQERKLPTADPKQPTDTGGTQKQHGERHRHYHNGSHGHGSGCRSGYAEDLIKKYDKKHGL